MAVDDEERPVEVEPQLVRAQCRVRRSGEILCDHNVRRVGGKRVLDVAHAAEIRRLDARGASGEHADLDAGLVVQLKPIVRHRRRRRVGDVEELDLVSHPRERDGEEGGRGADTACPDEAEHLVGDERYALPLGHRSVRLAHTCP